MTYEDWRARLAAANDPAFYPITWIDDLVSSGKAQFWDCGDAAMITVLRPYPGGAVTCETLAAAGDVGAMIDLLKPAIEEWAAGEGCTHCVITAGRNGWRRKHPDYRHQQTTLVKELR